MVRADPNIGIRLDLETIGLRKSGEQQRRSSGGTVETLRGSHGRQGYDPRTD
jgi:hypothetical protein